MRRPTYRTVCRFVALGFVLAAVALGLSACAVYPDKGGIVGCLAGAVLCILGASAAAHSARHG